MPTYADLIAKRANRTRRTITHPLCFDPAAWDAYKAARDAVGTAKAADVSRRVAGTKTPTKLNAPTEVQVAEAALEQATTDMLASSMWVHLRVPTALEVEQMVEANPAGTSDTARNINHLVALFDHATDLNNEPIDGMGPDEFRAELEQATAPTIVGILAALNQAAEAPRFPTMK